MNRCFFVVKREFSEYRVHFKTLTCHSSTRKKPRKLAGYLPILITCMFIFHFNIKPNRSIRISILPGVDNISWHSRCCPHSSGNRTRKYTRFMWNNKVFLLWALQYSGYRPWSSPRFYCQWNLPYILRICVHIHSYLDDSLIDKNSTIFFFGLTTLL